jgi:4-amino-4-deoxy-L-arabinose transferase-like glycosyltransferase
MAKTGKQAPEKHNFSERLGYLSERYSLVLVSGIFTLALLLRAFALFSLKNSIYFDFLLWDERVYHAWATKIADGTYQSTSIYEFSPLPAYLMALIYKIVSPDILYIRFLNIILGVFACYLAYLIGKEMANRTIGLFACLIAALYKPFIFYSIVPLKTSLSVFLFALTIYLFVAILNKYSMIKLLILGIAAGLMLNVRPNFVVITPLILLITLLSLFRKEAYKKSFFAALIVFIVGLSISIFPFMVRNYRVSGNFALTTSQTGFNLFIGNNLQNPDPYYRPVPFASSSPFKQGVQFTIEASRRTHKKLSPQEASSYWSREVFKMALEQPGAFIWKLLQKTLVFFNQFEAGDHYHMGFISDFVGFFKFPFPSLWLILPFGMAGMAVSCVRTGKFLALFSTFLLYASTLIIFFTTTRYRLPLLVILIPFAVIGISYLNFFIKTGQFKNIAVYSSIAIAFFIVEFIPVRGTGDMTAYYNTHAIILDSKGLKEEAIKYWENSSQMNRPFSAFANLALAGKYFKKGEITKTIYYLDKIPENSFSAAIKYEMIGDMLVHQGQIERAIAAYQRSLEINSGQRRPRLKLIRIYDNIDRERAFQEKEKFQYISSFYTIF